MSVNYNIYKVNKSNNLILYHHLFRITIRENVDMIRLQKQLSDKSTALRVTQEKFNDLQEVKSYFF